MRTTTARVVAIARKDFTLERSYQFQLCMRFLGIGVSILTFFFLGRLVGDAAELEGYRGGYFEFALLGLMVLALSLGCVNGLSRSIQSAQNDGTLEILLSTATRVPTLLAGTLVVPVVFGLVEASLYLLIGSVTADLRLTAASLLLAALLLLLTVGTFAAVGVLSAAVIVLTKRGDPLSVLVLQATTLLAGAMYPVDVLPEAMQAMSRLVPAFYGLRGIREVLLADGGLAAVAPDLLALVLFNAVLLPGSLWCLSRALRVARVTGTLGNR